MTITPQQLKAGRQLLGWSRSDLAGHCGVSMTTMAHFERGTTRASVLDLSTMRRVLETAGVEFPEEHGATGVRLRKPK
jgi:transcriptional regulator with XRE-family HTH domain